MRFKQNVILLLGGLSLLCQHVLAQSGYNYARPDITASANIPTTPATASGLRPIVAGFPSGATTAAGAIFPATAAAPFGVGGANVAATQPYGGYGPQAQRPGGPPSTYSPTAIGGGASGPAIGAGVPLRPTLPQRPQGSGVGGGIYGGGTQFGAGGRGVSSGQPAVTGQTGGDTGYGTDYDGDYSAIPGTPGVDYPVYGQVPQTNFNCFQQPLPGYYSDVEAQCQVFHICALNRTYSFLCPNGTIFSQETLVCVWWNQFDCASAPNLYANNAFIYDYGNEGPPTNAGFRRGSQQPTTYSTGGPIGRSPTPTPAGGIFGAGPLSGRLGPTAISGEGRFTPSPVATTNAQTFPATAGATTTPFGTPVLRGLPIGSAATVNVGGGGGGPAIGSGINRGIGPGIAGVQGNANANVPTAATATNREYLPPTRRPQKRYVSPV